MFDTELDFFIENQEELVKSYDGKILAIKGREIIGVYDNYLEAYLETRKKHKPGTFAIQKCIAGPDAYTITIATRGLIINEKAENN